MDLNKRHESIMIMPLVFWFGATFAVASFAWVSQWNAATVNGRSCQTAKGIILTMGDDCPTM